MTKRKTKTAVEVKSLPVDWIEITDKTEFNYVDAGAVVEATDVLLFKGNGFGAKAGRVQRYLMDYQGMLKGDVLTVDMDGKPALATHYIVLDCIVLD